MANNWKVFAIAGLLVVASFFAIAAFAQTTPPTNTSLQRGGMMGSSAGGTQMGRGMMGGGSQAPDWEDMGSMMGSQIAGGWQGMVSYCRNITNQFGSWYGNATSP
jgi:hypothetical protein